MRTLATCLLLLGGLVAGSGCATSSSVRGDVELGRLRVLSKVDVLPQLARVPNMDFPEVLLAQGIEGTAEISYTVDTSGSTTNITVKSASDPAFGEAAVRIVRLLPYVPATRSGRRVTCAVEVTFFFRIH